MVSFWDFCFQAEEQVRKILWKARVGRCQGAGSRSQAVAQPRLTCPQWTSSQLQALKAADFVTTMLLMETLPGNREGDLLVFHAFLST